VVKKLVEIQHQAWLDGYQSVRYTHLNDTVTTHFPLWLISFWAAVVNLRKNNYKPWIAARAWLNAEIQQKRSSDHCQLAEDARVFLPALPWDNVAVGAMWRFLGPHGRGRRVRTGNKKYGNEWEEHWLRQCDRLFGWWGTRVCCRSVTSH
jgi:hypothetical protein